MAWQDEAVRIHETVVKQYPVWSEEDTHFLALALCGEVGELANVIKKEWRGDDIELLPKLMEEFADVRIYLELLARAYGIDLDVACDEKLLELYERWPETKPRPLAG